MGVQPEVMKPMFLPGRELSNLQFAVLLCLPLSCS